MKRDGKHAHPAAPAVCPAAQSAPYVRTRGADKILKTLVCRAHGRARGRTKLPKSPRIPGAWPGAGSSPARQDARDFGKRSGGGKHAHPAAPAVCPAAQSAPRVRTRGTDKILKTLVCRTHGRARGRTKLPKSPRIPGAWPGAGSSPRARGAWGFEKRSGSASRGSRGMKPCPVHSVMQRKAPRASGRAGQTCMRRLGAPARRFFR